MKLYGLKHTYLNAYMCLNTLPNEKGDGVEHYIYPSNGSHHLWLVPDKQSAEYARLSSGVGTYLFPVHYFYPEELSIVEFELQESKNEN